MGASYVSLSVVVPRIALKSSSAAPLQMKKAAARRRLTAECSVRVQRWSLEMDASAIALPMG